MARRKCKTCREWFEPVMPIQPTCLNEECQVAFAIAHAQKERKKTEARLKRLKKERAQKERRELAKRKEAVLGSGHYMDLADKAFQRWARLRDHNDPCISCGRYEWEIPYDGRLGGKWDGGHYLSKGAHTEIRYNEDNCHKQCKHCNKTLSGNQAEYRARLIAKIGLERVEKLEGPHELTHHRIEDYKRIQKHYRRLGDELQKQIEACT